MTIHSKYRFLLCTIILLCACSAKKETIKPQVKSITESVYASGIIKTEDQYQVFAPASGIIKALLVAEGDEVKKGQVIATLANDALVANSETAKIAASFNDVQNNQTKIKEAERNVELAQLKMENDALFLNRQRNLWQQDIGTRAEVDNRELVAKNSRAAYENALLQLQDLKKQLTFNAAQARSGSRAATAQVADLDVRSSLNGRVFTFIKKQGEMVTPQSPLAVIGDDKAFYIELQVDENDIARVQPGQTVYITMDSYKNQVFEAKVTRLIPYMNERTRTFEIEAHFTAPPPSLYPNLTTEANILISQKDKALLIPSGYLLDENYVLLKNGEKKKIVTGIKDYEQVEVISGLTPADEIVKPGL